MDSYGHGTEVAGVLGASSDNGIGVAGVAGGVKVMALKVSIGATGSIDLASVAKALDYVTVMKSRGVNVVVTNNSYGGPSFFQPLEDAIGRQKSAGILFVAAAGNSGANNDATPIYPANSASDNVISVAATDHRDLRASFSSYGAVSVDLAAPGVVIRTTTLGGGYGYDSGTSLSAPMVSGVAALVASAVPTIGYVANRNAILQGVDPLPDLAGKVATGGRLNAYKSVLSVSSPSVKLAVKDEFGLVAAPSQYARWIWEGNTAAGQRDGIQRAFDFGGSPAGWHFLTGDMDGDGKDDFIAVDATGTGTAFARWNWVKNVNGYPFGPTVSFDFGGIGVNWQYATGDFNGDGLGDFAVISPQGNDAIWRWEPNVNGVRGGNQKSFLFGGYSPDWHYVVGDFSGDGQDDFGVVSPQGNESLWRWEPNVNGVRGGNQKGFTFGGYGPGWQYVTGDFSGDGRDDFGVLTPVTNPQGNADAHWIWETSSPSGVRSFDPHEFNFGGYGPGWLNYLGGNFG